MEITGKVLREVEFRDRLRGYDFEEVDEFLEQVAVAVDAMQAELTSHRESLKLADDRIAKAEALIAELESQPSSGESKPIDDEGIRKTLMLAQRTADMAIAEAKAEADKILSGARTDAEKVLSEADDYVKNMKTEAEKGLSSRIESMTAQHDQLVAEIKVLNQVLKAERARLTEALNSALRFVAQAFPVNESVANIAENGHTGLSSLLNSASNGSSEVSDNSVSNSASPYLADAHAVEESHSTDYQDGSDGVGGADETAQNDISPENGLISSPENVVISSDDDGIAQANLSILSSVKENPEFSVSEAEAQSQTTLQRDDGIVDSLLQDMFESLGQDNDDEIMWARFTSSSMDVDVAKRVESQSSTPDISASSGMTDHVGENNTEGEVLQFERNKKQTNN